MGRDPEQRSVRVQDGHNLEVRSFLTDYANHVTTPIEFSDSVVVAIKQGR